MMRFALLATLTISSGMAHAASPPVLATAYCPMTRVTGHGQGPTKDVAANLATEDCIAKGGMPGCCRVFVTSDKCQWRPAAEYGHTVCH